MRLFMQSFVLVLVAMPCAAMAADEAPSSIGYNEAIHPLFAKYCTACHAADEPEGKLVLESYDGLLRGGKHGAAIAPGKADDSRLVRMLTGVAKPVMPPDDSERPSPEEIAALKRWIDAGAKGPTGAGPDPTLLVVPKIEPRANVTPAVSALAVSPDGKLLAIARRGEVEIVETKDRRRVHLLTGHAGKVGSLAFGRDGKHLVAGAGEPGLFGEAILWNVGEGKPAGKFRGHRDALYAAKLNGDGSLLATASYDQKVIVWDVATGKPRYTIDGHNGAVFDLAFSPDGKLLATASADRTVKLWNVADGRRLDTLGQPLKDVYCVAISPDGRRIAAGGVDRRIRVWEITAGGREGTNPLVYSRFAHDGAVLRLAYSADGKTLVSAADNRTIKIWNAEAMTPRRTLETQSDLTAGIALSADGALYVGRLDGSLQSYALDGGDATVARDDDAVADATSDFPVGALPADVPAPPLAEAVTEQEPNDDPAVARKLTLNDNGGVATGRIHAADGGADRNEDVDLWRFSTRRDETFVVETSAAREQSPCDTKVEVLYADGRPVPRVLLQAVRDTSVTFRGADANQTGFRITNWEEMELNQYMYVGGDICRLFRFPQGPDSDFLYYESNGRRRAYFDTTATAHYLDEPAYIVRPLAVGSQPVPTGLPVFPLNYLNDDGSDRKIGTDSRLTFTAPDDGDYLVRVSDTRGFGGEKFSYRLTVRRPRPEFSISFGDQNPTVGAGSGKRFVVRAERIDGYEGEIRVDIAGVPPGFTVSSPLVIPAGHERAWGVIHATADAPQPTNENASTTRATATAVIGGRTIVKTVDALGEIKLSPKPKLLVRLELDNVQLASSEAEADANSGDAIAPRAPEPSFSADDRGAKADEAAAVVLVPGTTVTARLVIERNGFDGDLKFDVDNLPHGVIVDNIGLSGIFIPAGKTERQLFLSARDWAPEQTRPFQAVALVEGNQASLPLLLEVRAPRR
ncbi:MAG: c-type cytochrome domain-containing protein [Pirellulales bacterium]